MKIVLLTSKQKQHDTTKEIYRLSEELRGGVSYKLVAIKTYYLFQSVKNEIFSSDSRKGGGVRSHIGMSSLPAAVASISKPLIGTILVLPWKQGEARRGFISFPWFNQGRDIPLLALLTNIHEK